MPYDFGWSGVGNYAGSSGYGVDAQGRYGYQPGRRSSFSTPDYPVYFNGRYISIQTQKPWTGKLQTGQTTKAGVIVPESEPSFEDRYKAREVIKDPVIAAEADKLQKTFDDTAATTTTDYQSYLKDFKTQAQAAIDAMKTAADTGPDIEALRNAQSRYSTGLDTAAADYLALNQDAAGRQRALVAEARDLSGYDAAQNAIKADLLAQATQAANRYHLGKFAGTNAGLGTDDMAAYLRASAQAALPIELAKQTERNRVLSDVAIPSERYLTGLETNRIGSFMPSVLGAQYQSATNLESAIQALRNSAATGNWQAAQYIAQIPEIAAALRQKILQGDSSLVGLLAQLRDQSRYRGLEDTQRVQVSQPMYFNMNTGGYPTSGGGSRYIGGGGGVSNYAGLTGTGGTIPTLSDTLEYTPTGGIFDPGLRRTVGYRNLATGANVPIDPRTGGVQYYNPYTR